MANRKSLSELYRPIGPKAIVTGLAWTSGGSQIISQAVDLSLPIRGIRLVLKGRAVIGTAAFTSGTPEGFLNLISEVKISGTNARQRGNVTLWDMDLATAWTMSHLYAYRGAGYFSINSGGGETIVPIPSTPFPANGATGYFNVATGTYDFRIVCDFPFHPHESNSFGRHPGVIPGFLVRNEEWKDSLQILLNFGTQAGAGATGCLGVSAATSTITFSGYGVGTGTPTVDLYSLPIVMGLDLKDQVVPGVLSRTSQPISGILQAAGTPATLLNLQKQPTPRVIIKSGTSTVGATPPAFATLNDSNLTTLGILLGGNRNVRNRLDLFTHKMQQVDVYDRDPIQGYTLLEFMDSGNPDSAYPGQDIGDGATFQLVGDTPGLANAFGIVAQEQVLHLPTGQLYSF